jgi:hypothetical protein
MLDLDSIEARAEYKLAHLEGQGISLRDITWTLQDVLNLVAELRAAREAKERVLDMHSSNSGGWCWECAHPSPCRTATALAAYRAVVGEATDA